MLPTQKKREIAVSSPLGEDVLLFRRMTATEQLGRLSEFNLDLLSENAQIKMEDILGKTMTVRLQLPGDKTRYFNGYVSRFCQPENFGRYACYQATLRPWLWFLTRTADCRIFQKKTVPDIIKAIFREHGFTDFKESLYESYQPREYCVQYRETDFDFVSRLMEQEGIYYYFKHDTDKHTLILADSYSAHDHFPDYEQIPYVPPQELALRQREHIFEWFISKEVQPGIYSLNDFDFEKPNASLEVKSPDKHPHAHADFEIYDYPGKYVKKDDGKRYSDLRIAALYAQYEQVCGRGNARGLAVGSLLTFTDHPREDQNREYLIVAATYELRSDEYETTPSPQPAPIYACSFTAIDSKTPYRSPCLATKPFVHGPQTAKVVGKAGEEIWTDQYGRVKVQFHWDRYGKSDENSSCWIRVSHPWAGRKWGALWLPRIGQEVVVDFLEGDPDQPIITGRVYNAEQKTPYELPSDQTQSGIKSNSSKGGGGFNEIRFADKKGGEEVYLHAERNLTIEVKNDESRAVKHNRTTQIQADDSETIGNNQSITVGSSQTLKVGSSQSNTIGSSQSNTIGSSRSTTIASSDSLTVGASVQITTGASLTITSAAGVTINSAAPVTITAPMVSLETAMVQVAGVVQCTMLIAPTVVGATYTPGVGNLI
jgi:type VI secretion system secreted protein VgrG